MAFRSFATCAGEELFLVRGKQSGLWQLPGGMIEAKMAGCLVNLYKLIMIFKEKDPDSIQPFFFPFFECNLRGDKLVAPDSWLIVIRLVKLIICIFNLLARPRTQRFGMQLLANSLRSLGETGETMDAGRELPFKFRVCCVARRLVVKLLCRLHARSLSRMKGLLDKRAYHKNSRGVAVLHDGTFRP